MDWIQPVTDRIFGDIQNAKNVLKKLKNGDQESIREMKGCLNFSDMNRIENNLAFLADELRISFTVKTNWAEEDVPVIDDMSRILNNAVALRDRFVALAQDVEEIPEKLSTYIDFNKLENILLFMYDNLPDEEDSIQNYTTVEYLESTGTQYINTGLLPDGGNAYFNTSFMITNVDTDVGFVCANQHQGLKIKKYSDRFKIYISGTSADGNEIIYDYGTLPTYEKRTWGGTIDSGWVKLYEDGRLRSGEYGVNGTIASNDPYVLFGAGDHAITGRIYWCQISTAELSGNDPRFDSTLQRNFVPVIRKSDGKPGLWDYVTQRFYTNAGTGEFIVP